MSSPIKVKEENMKWLQAARPALSYLLLRSVGDLGTSGDFGLHPHLLKLFGRMLRRCCAAPEMFHPTEANVDRYHAVCIFSAKPEHPARDFRPGPCNQDLITYSFIGVPFYCHNCVCGSKQTGYLLWLQLLNTLTVVSKVSDVWWPLHSTRHVQFLLMGVASVEKSCMSSAPCCGTH